jgi:hypothetical protein
MKKRMHWWFLLLFVWALAYDLIVWGAAARLPEIGDKLKLSAHRNAWLATMYMAGGDALVAAVPVLEGWGADRAQRALSEGFPRIKDDPNVGMDLIFSQTWNSSHATLKFAYWAAPVLGLITLILFSRRPKKIHMMGR